MFKPAIKILFGLLIVFTVSSCVQTITDPTSSKPTIKIYKPIAGDTIAVGANKVTYEASAGLGSAGITFYAVVINGDTQNATKFTQNENGSNPNIDLTVYSPLIGKEIEYYIEVYNEENQFTRSDIIKGVLVLETYTAPIAPVNLQLIRNNDNQISLFWTDSSTDESQFEVWRRDGADGTYRIVKTLPANSNNYLDNSLSPFITYYYRIRATNKFGNSPFSNEVNSGGGGSNPPTNLKAEPLGASIVQLTWTDNASDENGYKIQRRALETDDWVTYRVLSPNTEEYIDQGLAAQTTYRYRVGVFTSNTEGYSNEVVVTTFTEDIPGPSNLTADFDENLDAVKITWIDNTVLENGTVVERRVGLSGNFTQIGATGADENSFIDNSITTGLLYYYRAKHSTTEGYFTPYSNEDTAYVPYVPLKAPSDLEITEFIAGTLYGLKWVNNASNEDGLQLWRKENASGTYHLYKVFPARTQAYNDTVAAGIIYYYKVRAFLGTEFSAFSEEVSSAGGSGNLFRPTNLVASAVPNQIAIDLSWVDNSSDELGFEIERRITGSVDFNKIDVVGPNTQFYRDDTDGLFRGTSYDYRVRAYNQQGFSEYSNIYQATVPF